MREGFPTCDETMMSETYPKVLVHPNAHQLFFLL